MGKKTINSDSRTDKEQMLIELLDNAKLAVILLDIDGTIINLNQLGADTIGKSRDELIGICKWDLYPAEIAEYRKSLFDEVLRSGKPQTIEDHQGNRDFEITISPTFDNNGKVRYVTIYGYDITERKRAEEALRESEERYRNLFEESPISIWEEDFSDVKTYIESLRDSEIKDLRKYLDSNPDIIAHCATLTKIIAVNKATLEMYGAESKEEFRNDLGKIFREESYEAFKEEVIALAEGKTRFETETLNRSLKGEDKHIILKWSVAPGHEKTLSKVLISIIDITERKLVEDALRQSELKYHALFEGMLDGFALHEMIFDANNNPVDYKFLEVNPAFEKMTGLSAKDIVGKTILDVLPDTELAWIETYGQVVQTGMPHRFENYSKELHKYFEVLAYRTEPSRFATIFVDITKRKQLEDQLRQSEKMQAIGQLAGGIAHDFNNQLSGVLGYADMLGKKLEDEKLSRYANNIKKGAIRAAELTAELLAFSRKGKTLSIPVDIHKVLDDVYSILEHSIDKRIRMLQLLKADPSTTMGDPSQLQNAILNIAINARDAMPEGGEIIFETGITKLNKDFCKNHPYKLLPGKYIKLNITDNGCGMDTETQKHIYEPFFTTKEIGKGTGMGLASVYGTVRNHKGAINAYSEVGHGTTFNIYLPLVENIHPGLENKVRSAPITGTAKILLVDDEEMVRNLGADMLRELGYQVTTANNGKKALEIYKKSWKKIDLVILDMVMPELGGRDTFAALHKINPNIRAILSSGYSINGEAQAILDEGVLAFVGKPYDQTKLSETVAQVLQMGGSSPAEDSSA